MNAGCCEALCVIVAAHQSGYGCSTLFRCCFCNGNSGHRTGGQQFSGGQGQQRTEMQTIMTMIRIMMRPAKGAAAAELLVPTKTANAEEAGRHKRAD